MKHPSRERSKRSTGPAVVLVLAVALLVACGDRTDTGDTEDVGATGDTEDETSLSLAGSWELTGLTVGGAPVDLPDRPLLITIADGRIEGDGSCNRFSGPLERGDGGSLRIGPLEQTEMACADLEFESAYVGALAAASGWEGAADGVTFTSAGTSADARITYRAVAAEPVAAAPLVGTVWELDTVYGPGEGPARAASTIDRSAPGVELVVDATTATLISEPCTDAVYEVAVTEAEGGGSLEVLGGGAVECQGSEGDNPNLDVASGGLVSASGYLLDGDRLVLIGEEGELIGFRAQAPDRDPAGG